MRAVARERVAEMREIRAGADIMADAGEREIKAEMGVENTVGARDI